MNNSYLNPLSLIFLSKRIPWFGSYTGYEQLPKFIEKTYLQTKILSVKPGLIQRLIGKTYSSFRKWRKRSSYITAAEFFLELSRLRKPEQVTHLLYSEGHLPYLDRWHRAPKNIIGTVHLPPDQWEPEMLENLKRLSSAIVLYRRDIPFFEKFVGSGRVVFTHYGVDTTFFHPGDPDLVNSSRVLFAGHYLRNTKMLSRVISKLSNLRPKLKFDLLVPEHVRNVEGLCELQKHPKVTWHQKLSDEELREIYQKSYLLLLPMSDSGANTAVVESLACGLPIVTTDVGGIRDYGGGETYPLVHDNDDDAMIALVEKYLDNLDWRNEISQRSRKFSEKTLDWEVVTQMHLEAYQYLLT